MDIVILWLEECKWCSRGQVRVKGVERTTNAILHPWLKSELEAIVATLAPAPERSLEENRLL